MPPREVDLLRDCRAFVGEAYRVVAVALRERRPREDAERNRLAEPVAALAVDGKLLPCEPGPALGVARLHGRGGNPVREVAVLLIVAGHAEELARAQVLRFGEVEPARHVERRAAQAQRTCSQRRVEAVAGRGDKRV